jgi:hypothetical protein
VTAAVVRGVFPAADGYCFDLEVIKPLAPGICEHERIPPMLVAPAANCVN